MPENNQPATPANAESTTDRIKLMPIQKLLGKKFFIPKYQRGYRWTERQVKDLLDDIWECHENHSGFYCLQTLVVIPRKITEKAFNSRMVNANYEDDIRGDILNAIEKLTQWDMIDGQQRLTTIKIILAYLGQPESESYSIEYETRTAEKNNSRDIGRGIGSRDFLDKIADYAEEDDNKSDDKKISNCNIDFFHMHQAYKTIKEWFHNKFNENDLQKEKVNFKETLLKNVEVIWYDAAGEDPIEVFTRLNIGKISLTNAELIKALFLNRSNLAQKSNDSLSLSQLEIASQWDNIEYTLQNDEFWMFFHDKDAPPTRIDYIFNYICKENLLYADHKNGKNSPEIIGSDNYRTFRYFDNYFKAEKTKSPSVHENGNKSPTEKCWEQVKSVFGTLLEWYNDCELYHYIGFLTKIHEERNRSDYAANLLTEWTATQSKTKFLESLKDKIQETLKNCSRLDERYEIPDAPKKTQCRPLLLLFNVQSVINQNKGYKESQQYRLGLFYKFPFHLYKKTEWDIEHIDSNTENQLDDANSQKEWVLSALYALYCNRGQEVGLQKTSQTPNSQTTAEDDNGDLIGGLIFNDQEPTQDDISKIKTFLSNPEDKNEFFEEIQKMLLELLEGQSGALKDDEKKSDAWGKNEKNQVWNFALLDQTTNRSYHNDIFPTKRRKLIAKDQGKTISLEWKNHSVVVNTKDAEIAFVPPCTKNAFLKYYTPGNNDIWKWNRHDAENYRQAMFDTLKEFGVTISENDKNQEGK